MTGAQIVMTVLIVLACVVVVSFAVSRKRGASKTFLNLPLVGRFSHNQEAEPAGTVVKNAESTAGGVNATDNTGSGVELDTVKVKKDIIATNNPAPQIPKS